MGRAGLTRKDERGNRSLDILVTGVFVLYSLHDNCAKCEPTGEPKPLFRVTQM